MTAFTDIYDQALVVMQDYTLDNLANTNYDAFLIFMKGLLKNGIPFFNCCLNNLNYEDVEEAELDENGNSITVVNSYFTADLTNKEQSILAMWKVISWSMILFSVRSMIARRMRLLKHSKLWVGNV